MRVYRSKRTLLVSGATVVSLLSIAGCGVSHDVGVTDPHVGGVALHGTVFGGLQPVSFSTLQLYAIGTTGYGSAATPLLTSVVTTDVNGNYSITGDYTCPSAQTMVYLAAVGGNPGLAAGTNNAALAEIALLGPCGNLRTYTFVTINELSTVAAVYAMQPFLSSISGIGTPASNQQGLNEGFTTAASLVSLPGRSPGAAPAIATIPTATLNSLADALSSCINSDGALSAYAPCGRLFTAATPTGMSAPVDTVGAALAIARNPSHNATAIFNTITSTAPYQPTLTAAPSDWSIAINYVAPSFHTPADLAVDSQGTVWVVGSPGIAATGSSTVSTLTSAGLKASYVQVSTNFGNLAIDQSDNVWLTDANHSDVVELSNSGVRTTFNPFSGGGIQGPGPIAFDPSGNAWVLNNASTLSELSASGVALSPANGFATGAGSAVALAIDAQGQVWTADSGNNSVSKLTNAGAAVIGSPYTNGGLSSPFAIAIDSTNEAFVASRTTSQVTKFAASGAPPASTSYAGSGVTVPIALAMDGANTAWVVNGGANTISAVPASNSGQTGYGSAFLTNPYKLAIDGAGNIWVANLGTSVAGSGVITQFVGAAAPVVTPLSVAVKNGTVAQRP